MAAYRSRRPTAVGIDLAGSPRRPTGYSVVRSRRSISAKVLTDDRAILGAVLEDRPDLVVVDAPLSLPAGRSSLEDRGGPHFRDCDRELRRLGIRFFPLTLGPMRMLTRRGIRLWAELEDLGFRVLEGYPGGSQDRMGLPRKGAGRALLQRALVRHGLGGVLAHRPLSHDELDAVTIAWTGRLFLAGRGVVIGDPDEGLMLLPELGRKVRGVRHGFGASRAAFGAPP